MTKLKALYGATTAAFVLATAALPPTPAHAQGTGQVQQLDIAAGSLGNAIAQLGRKAGVMIVFDPALVRARKTQGLHGSYTVSEALRLLLAGTGVEARPDDRGGYTLARTPRAVRKASAPVPTVARPADARTAEGGDILVTAQRAITATKTDTSLIQTPQAISVIPQALIADRNAINLQETLRYSAGVAAESYGTDMVADSIFVRGFAPAYFVDGMMRNMSFTGIPRTEPYLLERVELLRGPASILYGQGSSGGVVNAMTKRPQFKPGGEIAIQYGSWDRKQLQADLTGALNADGTLAGRMVALYRDSDQQTDYLKDNRLLLAPSLTWLPGADTSITLIGAYQRDLNGSSQQFLPVAATRLLGGPGLPVTRFLGEPDFDRQLSRQYSITAALAHRFNDALQFRSTSRYARNRVAFDEIYADAYGAPADPFLDAERRVIGRTYYSLRSWGNTFTTDNVLELNVETGPFHHKLIAGLDYLRFHEGRDRARGAAAPIDIYDPQYGSLPSVVRTHNPTVTQTQLGLYLQDQISYQDLATLVVGIRRDRAVAKTEFAPDETSTATTFRAGLIGNLGRGIAPYVSYSESFQPVAGLNFYDERFKPQRGRQWEAGIKWQPSPELLMSAAVFDIRETNRQTTDPANGANTIQTGLARSRGVEFEAGYTLPGSLTLTAAYAHIDATVLKGDNLAEIGEQLGEVPRHTASAWVMKAFRNENGSQLRLGTGVRYVGSLLSTTDGWQLRTPANTLVDALAEFSFERWTLSVRASNLFDKRYFASCRVYGDCFTGNARNVTATLGWRF